MRRRHDARGLVQQVVNEPGEHPDGCAVDFDEVAVHLHSPTEQRHLAVDGHAALADQLLARAPRAESDPGEHLLQPLALRLAHSPGSERSTFSSISTVEAGGTKATSGGRSSIESSPRRSRNIVVVPYKIGWPGPSSRPTGCT